MPTAAQLVEERRLERLRGAVGSAPRLAVRAHAGLVWLATGREREPVVVREGADLVGPTPAEHARARGHALRRRGVRPHKVDAVTRKCVKGRRRNQLREWRGGVDNAPIHRVAHEEKDIGAGGGRGGRGEEEKHISCREVAAAGWRPADGLSTLSATTLAARGKIWPMLRMRKAAKSELFRTCSLYSLLADLARKRAVLPPPRQPRPRAHRAAMQSPSRCPRSPSWRR